MLNDTPSPSSPHHPRTAAVLLQRIERYRARYVLSPELHRLVEDIRAYLKAYGAAGDGTVTGATSPRSGHHAASVPKDRLR